MRILIAEDEPVSRLRLERMLGRWGYEVTAVADGDEAWAVLSEKGAPGLAVLDWEMPGATASRSAASCAGWRTLPTSTSCC